MDVIGKRMPLINGIEKVTGSAQFVSDIWLPNMIYGGTLKSPHPHAKIVRLDLRRALKLEGVISAITAIDIPNNSSMFGISTADMEVLTSDKVRFVGDEIAAVAAIDKSTAERALELIEVEYEVLPAIFDTDAALKPGSLRIHDHLPPVRVISGNA